VDDADLGPRLLELLGEPAEDGRVRVELRSWSAHAFAGELAGIGGMVEVVEPPEARMELARVGEELSRMYGRPAVRGSKSPSASHGASAS